MATALRCLAIVVAIVVLALFFIPSFYAALRKPVPRTKLCLTPPIAIAPLRACLLCVGIPRWPPPPINTPCAWPR